MSPLLSNAAWVLLYPLAVLWAGLAKLRRLGARWFIVARPSRKVVAVGNVHSGGSGKTPIVAAIAEHFAALKPVIVSRGYKGALSRAGARVDLEKPGGPAAFGDEPWMLAHRLKVPVYIGSRRAEALRRAEKETEGTFFLLDDAFQNFSFRHDIDLAAVHADRRLDESFCLPLGDLREPVDALAAAKAVILVQGADEANLQTWKDFLSKLQPAPRVFVARPEVQGIWGPEGKVNAGSSLAWGAFCGIARPQAFEKSLEGWLRPQFVEAFADHHAYTPGDISRLLELKNRHGLNHLVTTEKDWHKAAPLFGAVSEALYYLRLGYVFSDEFWYFLQTQLETA